MSKVTVEMIQQLREKTGVGMMECKKALVETEGDLAKAVDLLRARGAKVAAKRAGQETNNGVIHAYIHPGSRLGVMVEIACETDFSANTDAMKNFAQDICMQIAAAHPVCVSSEELDEQTINKEKEIYRAQLKEEGKPEKLIDQIADQKIKKYYETACLMNQKFVKNDKLTIQDYLNELVAKINENIKIKRFARFMLGS